MKRFLFVAAFVAAFASDVTAQRRYEYSNDRDFGRDNGRSRSSRDSYSYESYGDDFDRRHAREYDRRDYAGRDFDRRDRWENNYAPDHWEQIAGRKIADGERRGLITRYEARRLYRYIDRVDQEERRYRRNGSFSRRERAQLADEIHDLFRDIQNQMHDDDVVYGYWGRRF